MDKCPHCNSKKIVKAGYATRAGKWIQLYLCKNCCRRFVERR
jgi:transposase-like protein